MQYRHSPQQIAAYFDSPDLNQSTCKLIISGGLEEYLDKREELQRQEDPLYYEEKEHQIIGSAVDVYFTQGRDEYYRQYAVSRMPRKPPEKPMSIVRKVFDDVLARKEEPGPYVRSYDKELYIAADLHQYYMNRRIPKLDPVKKPDGSYGRDERTWEDDKRIDGMLGDGLCQQYWEELKSSIGKQILADDESTKVGAIIKSFETHVNTSFIFKEEEGVDVIFQMALHFIIDGVKCKILPDIIIVDHNHRRIIPIDGKTTGRYVTKFNFEIRKWRYDIQGALYSRGIDLCRDQIGELIDHNIINYTLSNFGFIVESTYKPGTPLIYVLEDEVLMEGEFGDFDQNLRGFHQALETFKYWQIIDFSVEKMYADTHGIVRIGKGYQRIVT